MKSDLVVFNYTSSPSRVKDASKPPVGLKRLMSVFLHALSCVCTWIGARSVHRLYKATICRGIIVPGVKWGYAQRMRHNIEFAPGHYFLPVRIRLNEAHSIYSFMIVLILFSPSPFVSLLSCVSHLFTYTSHSRPGQDPQVGHRRSYLGPQINKRLWK